MEAEIRVAAFNPDFFWGRKRMKPVCDAASLLFLSITIAFFTACGSTSGSPMPSSQSFVYVANQDSQNISAFRRDPSSGALTPVAGSPFAVDVHFGVWWWPSFIVDSKNRFLFALNNNLEGTKGVGQLSVFVINPNTGALSEASGSPFSFPAASLESVSTDPQGRFVYVTTLLGGIVAWKIDRTHLTLIPVPGSPFGDKSKEYTASLDPAGKFLYATDGYDISIYAIDPDSGALSLTNGPFYLPQDSPMSFTLHPSGHIAYVSGHKNFDSPELWACLVDPSNGAVSGVQAYPAIQPLTISNNGKFLLSTLGTYAIDESSGLLSQSSSEPLKSLAPIAAATSPDSQFVYAVVWNQPRAGAASVFAFSLDETTGSLSPIVGSPYMVGDVPTAIAITH